jgi:CIC family chloride channel protein
MRDSLLIQTSVDLISRVLRVLLVGLLVGSASSLTALAMIKFISFGGHKIIEFENTHPGAIAVLMIVGIPTAGGLIVGHIVQYMSSQRPHNPADVILAAQSNLKLAHLTLKDGVLNFIASIISLVSGASLGQYGPIVNMGATLSAHLHKITRTEQTVLIGCGVAAAISSAFHAPIAGIVFAHEVILRHNSLRAFAPITVAAAIGFYLSKFVFYSEHLFQMEFVQILYLAEFAGFTVIGIFAGLLAVFFLKSVLYANLLSARLPLQQKFKPMIAGLCIGMLALKIPEILGVGDGLMRLTLYSPPSSAVEIATLLIAKIAAAALCLGFGFAGGVFSPALLIGVLFGTLFGMGVELLFPYSNIAVYAVCGMAAVTSPIIGAPLTTILIIFELTHNYELTTAVMISVVFSNVIAYRLFGRSLFDFQLKSRGYDLSYGRDPLILSTTSIAHIGRRAGTRVKPGMSIQAAIDLLVEDETNEAFVVDAGQHFIGSVALTALVKHSATNATLMAVEGLVNQHGLRFRPDTSIWDAMSEIKGFIGECIPIVDNKSGELTGIVYETDLIEVYMQTALELRSEETANA